MQVKDVIAAYQQAMEVDDRAAARQTLEALEGDAYRNEADWAEIRVFLQKEGFGGRLEIVTNGLIRKGAAVSGQPYFVLAGLFVKAGRLDQARPLIEKYKSFPQPPVTGWDQRRWDFANLLYDAQLYRDCLDELHGLLKLNPAHFGCGIMEAKTYWKLRETRLALKKFKQLKSHLGENAGHWQWYAAAAFEFGELALAQAVTAKLIKMIERGEGRLNYHLTHMLKKNGFAEDLTRLVFTADPSFYKSLAELTYMFDLALEFGAKKTATSFGHAILKLSPDKKLQSRIEQFFVEPGFLMA